MVECLPVSVGMGASTGDFKNERGSSGGENIVRATQGKQPRLLQKSWLNLASIIKQRLNKMKKLSHVVKKFKFDFVLKD